MIQYTRAEAQPKGLSPQIKQTSCIEIQMGPKKGFGPIVTYLDTDYAILPSITMLLRPIERFMLRPRDSNRIQFCSGGANTDL